MTETFEYKVFNSPRARGVELVRKMRYDLTVVDAVLSEYRTGNPTIDRLLEEAKENIYRARVMLDDGKVDLLVIEAVERSSKI